MDLFKFRLKSILLNELEAKCSTPEIDSITEKIMDLSKESEMLALHNKKRKFEWVMYSQILYIEKLKKQVEYHTATNVFFHPGNENIDLEDLELNDSFLFCDSKLIVNLNMVKKYDSYMRAIYFDDECTLKVQVIGKTLDMFKKTLGKEHDLYRQENWSAKKAGLRARSCNI